MNRPRWVAVTRLQELPRTEGRSFEVEGREIALFAGETEIHALGNTCPHQGAALAEGTVDGGEVACPWHGWRFRLADGDCTTIPGERAVTYPVRIVDGMVEVELQDASCSSGGGGPGSSCPGDPPDPPRT